MRNVDYFDRSATLWPDRTLLVTDQGKLIRTSVSGIRIAGRSTQGVIVLDTHEDERVVSVERLLSEDDGD